MGIPYYFKTITDMFPNILSGHMAPGACRRLFLDFNCAIHFCANHLKKEWRGKLDEFEAALLDHVCHWVDDVMRRVQPMEVLYVAMDGVPPFAKVIQQRKRRYLSALTRKWVTDELRAVTKASVVPETWDSNAISPGTAFMVKLADVLRQHLATTYPQLQCIVSDTEERGEGEQKIMRYLESVGAEGLSIVYGLDADLIMLSLIQHSRGHNIQLMREATFYDKRDTRAPPFVYMNIPLFCEKLLFHLNNQYSLTGPTLLNSYIFLCFFIGNDFVPHMSFLKLKEDGLPFMLMAYKRVSETLGGEAHMLEADNSLNTGFFLKWLEQMVSFEDDMAWQAQEAHYHRQPPRFQPPPPPTHHGGHHRKPPMHMQQAAIEQKYHYYGLLFKGAPVIPAQSKGWRRHYYKELFDQGVSIHDVCYNYMEGLQWLIEAYFRANIHDGWYFKHAYGPTLLDMFNHITSYVVTWKTDVQKSITENYDAYRIPNTALQLLCILPPSSAHLLQTGHIEIMRNPKHGCVHLFPYTFGLCTYLKAFLWECTPLVPHVEVEALAHALVLLQTGGQRAP